MIYFTSDLHWWHDREFVWGKRGFSNVREMTKAIFDEINKTVGPEDTLYILGDLMLGDTEAGITLLQTLRCADIHIILGNHDTVERAALYEKCWNVTEVVYATVLKYGKWRFYLSHYRTQTGNTTDHGPTKSLINLYGHTHQPTSFAADDTWQNYNVGVDAHGCRPVSIDQIIEEILTKYNKGE